MISVIVCSTSSQAVELELIPTDIEHVQEFEGVFSQRNQFGLGYPPFIAQEWHRGATPFGVVPYDRKHELRFLIANKEKELNNVRRSNDWLYRTFAKAMPLEDKNLISAIVWAMPFEDSVCTLRDALPSVNLFRDNPAYHHDLERLWISSCAATSGWTDLLIKLVFGYRNQNWQIHLSQYDIRSFINKCPVQKFRLLQKSFPGSDVMRPIYIGQKDLESIIDGLNIDMFHPADPAMISFLTRVYPHWWSSYNRSIIDRIVEALIGAMRTNVIEVYKSYPSKREVVMKYLTLTDVDNCISRNEYLRTDAAAWILIYEYKCNFPLYSSPFPSLSRRPKSSSMQLIKLAPDHHDDQVEILMPAEEAVRVLIDIAPRGIFHKFSEEEIYLVNLIRPTERLSAEQRIKWREILVGSYRSMSIRQGLLSLANRPLP
ncbi:MAG: hypothetical protein LBJ92_04765 [Holosporales bacterium]|jgi:hypothetical protein|nr:hypothetical protein [Holosporales bacterium]